MVRKKKRVLYPVMFMLTITAVFSLSLAILNHLTKDTIAYNNEKKLKETILYVFNIEGNESIDNLYDEMIEEDEINDIQVYVAKDNSNILGYAFPIEGDGLWGSISGYAAISPDFERLLGIDFISQSETPGLGGRIGDEAYKEQFRNLRLEASDSQYIVHRPKPGGNIDAITGATSSSEAVRKLLNEDIHNFIQNAGGDS